MALKEMNIIWGKRLGRLDPKNAPALRLADIRTGALPTHPLAVDYLSRVAVWQMLGNNRFGDCGPVSVSNSRALTTLALTGAEQYPTLTDTLDLYRRSGNPNFNPDTGEGDNGVDMQTMLEAVHKTGIAGVKCVAFAKVDPSNIEELRAAIAIFGFVLLGSNLDRAQQSQSVWDYTPGSIPWGGHATMAGTYTSNAQHGASDISDVSWGDVYGMTDEFIARQVEEAWVVIWPEHLGAQQFLEGIDLLKLTNAYHDLTGRVLPLPTPPAPPAPHHVPPQIQELIKMWTDLGNWLRSHGWIK